MMMLVDSSSDRRSLSSSRGNGFSLLFVAEYYSLQFSAMFVVVLQVQSSSA